MTDPIRVQQRLHSPGTLRLAPPRRPTVSLRSPQRADETADAPVAAPQAPSAPARRSAVTSAAFDALLQRTDATDLVRRGPRVFVCAAATGREPVGAVVETLVDHAADLGMTVRRGRLTDGLLGGSAATGVTPFDREEIPEVLRGPAVDVAFLEADHRRMVPEVARLLRAGATPRLGARAARQNGFPKWRGSSGPVRRWR